MKWRDALMLAISGLRGNVVRTFLSVLGLSVGVGAVLTVLTLSTAGELRVEEEIEKLGVNKVWIRARDEDHVLSADDAFRVQTVTRCPASAGAYTVTSIRQGSRIITAQSAGFDAQMQLVLGPKLVSGRLFGNQDHNKAQCVCLVDETLAEQLGGDVIGQRIAIAQRRMLVVGVVKKLSMQAMSGVSGLVILPLATFLDTFGGDVMEITLSVQRGQRAELVAEQALAALGEESFRADTLIKEINAAREIVRIFVMVLFCVAAVCMLTGGIGIMNVLLLAVRERTREIGLIKAVGGTSAQVVWLFLLEASAYALAGGGMGVILGMIILHPLSNWIGLAARLELKTILPVLLGAAFLGAIFGAGPAIKAGRLEPITALQGE